MPDLDKLQKDVNELNELLKDRHEGVSSWCIAVGQRWQSIAEAWSGPTPLAPDGAVCSCERPHHATSHPDICLSCGKPRRKTVEEM